MSQAVIPSSNSNLLSATTTSTPVKSNAGDSTTNLVSTPSTSNLPLQSPNNNKLGAGKKSKGNIYYSMKKKRNCHFSNIFFLYKKKRKKDYIFSGLTN